MLLYNSLSCCGTNNICRLLPHCTAFRTDVLPHPVHDQPCCWIVPALIAVFLSCREINGSDQRQESCHLPWPHVTYMLPGLLDAHTVSTRHDTPWKTRQAAVCRHTGPPPACQTRLGLATPVMLRSQTLETCEQGSRDPPAPPAVLSRAAQKHTTRQSGQRSSAALGHAVDAGSWAPACFLRLFVAAAAASCGPCLSVLPRHHHTIPHVATHLSPLPGHHKPPSPRCRHRNLLEACSPARVSLRGRNVRRQFMPCHAMRQACLSMCPCRLHCPNHSNRMQRSPLEDYCFMRAVLMVMRLPLEPCMQLRLLCVRPNQFADDLCATSTPAHPSRPGWWHASLSPPRAMVASGLAPCHSRPVCGKTDVSLELLTTANTSLDCSCPLSSLLLGRLHVHLL